MRTARFLLLNLLGFLILFSSATATDLIVAQYAAPAPPTRSGSSTTISSSTYSNYSWHNIPAGSTRNLTMHFYAKARNDIHIAVRFEAFDYYEIVLGGWNNNHSIVRRRRISSNGIKKTLPFVFPSTTTSNNGGGNPPNNISIPGGSTAWNYYRVSIDRGVITLQHYENTLNSFVTLFTAYDSDYAISQSSASSPQQETRPYNQYSFRDHDNNWQLSNLSITTDKHPVLALEKQAQELQTNIDTASISMGSTNVSGVTFQTATLDLSSFSLTQAQLDTARTQLTAAGLGDLASRIDALSTVPVNASNTRKAQWQQTAQALITEGIRMVNQELSVAPSFSRSQLADYQINPTGHQANYEQLNTLVQTIDLDTTISEPLRLKVIEYQEAIAARAQIFNNLDTLKQAAEAALPAFLTSIEALYEDDTVTAATYSELTTVQQAYTDAGLNHDELVSITQQISTKKSAQFTAISLAAEKMSAFRTAAIALSSANINAMGMTAFSVLSQPGQLDANLRYPVILSELLNPADIEEVEEDRTQIRAAITAREGLEQQLLVLVAEIERRIAQAQNITAIAELANLPATSFENEADIRTSLPASGAIIDQKKNALEVAITAAKNSAAQNEINRIVQEYNRLAIQITQATSYGENASRQEVDELFAWQDTITEIRGPSGPNNPVPGINTSLHNLWIDKNTRLRAEQAISWLQRFRAIMSEYSQTQAGITSLDELATFRDETIVPYLQAEAQQLINTLQGVTHSLGSAPTAATQEELDAISSGQVMDILRSISSEYDAREIAITELVESGIAALESAKQAALDALAQATNKNTLSDSNPSGLPDGIDPDAIATYQAILNNANKADERGHEISSRVSAVSTARAAKIAALDEAVRTANAVAAETNRFLELSYEQLAPLTDDAIRTELHLAAAQTAADAAYPVGDFLTARQEELNQLLQSVQSQRDHAYSLITAQAAVTAFQERVNRYKSESLATMLQPMIGALTLDDMNTAVDLAGVESVLASLALPENITTQHATTISQLVESLSTRRQTRITELQTAVTNAMTTLLGTRDRLITTIEGFSELDQLAVYISAPFTARQDFDTQVTAARQAYEEDNRLTDAQGNSITKEQIQEINDIVASLEQALVYQSKLIRMRTALSAIETPGNALITAGQELVNASQDTNTPDDQIPTPADIDNLDRTGLNTALAHAREIMAEEPPLKATDIPADAIERKEGEIEGALADLRTILSADMAEREALQAATEKRNRLSTQTQKRTASSGELTPESGRISDPSFDIMRINTLDEPELQREEQYEGSTSFTQWLTTLRTELAAVGLATTPVDTALSQITTAIEQRRRTLANTAMSNLQEQERLITNAVALIVVNEETNAQEALAALNAIDTDTLDANAIQTTNAFQAVSYLNDSAFDVQRITDLLSRIASIIENKRDDINQNSAGLLLTDLQNSASILTSSINSKTSSSQLQEIQTTTLAAFIEKVNSTLDQLTLAQETAITEEERNAFDPGQATAIQALVQQAFDDQMARVRAQEQATQLLTALTERVNSLITALGNMSEAELAALPPLDNTQPVIEALAAALRSTTPVDDETDRYAVAIASQRVTVLTARVDQLLTTLSGMTEEQLLAVPSLDEAPAIKAALEAQSLPTQPVNTQVMRLTTALAAERLTALGTLVDALIASMTTQAVDEIMAMQFPETASLEQALRDTNQEDRIPEIEALRNRFNQAMFRAQLALLPAPPSHESITGPTIESNRIAFGWQPETTPPSNNFAVGFYTNSSTGFALGLQYTAPDGSSGHYVLRLGDDNNTNSTIQRRGRIIAQGESGPSPFIFGQNNGQNNVGQPRPNSEWNYYRIEVVRKSIRVMYYDANNTDLAYQTIIYTGDQHLTEVVETFTGIGFHKLATQGLSLSFKGLSLTSINPNHRPVWDGTTTSQTVSTPTEPETTEPIEPETTEPDTTEPETTEPETTEPEVTEPIEPETTQPEVTEPIEPETTEPETTEPETTEPETTEPETTEPETTEPETTEPETTEPETTEPETTEPETTEPETTEPETTEPETTEPEVTEPIEPETTQPEVTEPIEPETTEEPEPEEVVEPTIIRSQADGSIVIQSGTSQAEPLINNEIIFAADGSAGIKTLFADESGNQYAVIIDRTGKPTITHNDSTIGFNRTLSFGSSDLNPGDYPLNKHTYKINTSTALDGESTYLYFHITKYVDNKPERPGRSSPIKVTGPPTTVAFARASSFPVTVKKLPNIIPVDDSTANTSVDSSSGVIVVAPKQNEAAVQKRVYHSAAQRSQRRV